MTEVAYRPLTLAEDIYKSLVWDPMVTAAEGLLIADAPWLAWGPLPKLTDFVVHRITDGLFELQRLQVDLLAIRFVNAAHARAFETASMKLLDLAHQVGTDSPDFLKAREDAKKALAEFAHFGAALMYRRLRHGPQYGGLLGRGDRFCRRYLR